ncbi:MAG: hypothetical protein IPK03_08530 [Bacteroidetes bacterium]|nr:hypothetical protein [Bacteroidota bacterium]
MKQQAEDRARHTADSFQRVAEAEAQRRVEQAKQEAAKKIEEEKNKLLNNLKKKLPW